MNSGFTEYVSVIAVDFKLGVVALIEKLKGPEHLRHKLTVPGGKVAPGEAYKAAAVREFKEETGVELDEDSLVMVASKGDCNYSLMVYIAETDKVFQVRPQPGELEQPFICAISTFLKHRLAMPDIVEVLKHYMKEHDK